MSNLGNLTDKILEEAKIKAQRQIGEAEAFSKDTVSRKVREAEEKKAKMLEKAAFDANLLKERMISNAEVNSRNEVLSSKQKIIDKVFEEAKKRLGELPENDYIEYVKTTLSSLKLKGTETLLVKKEYRDDIKALGLPYEISEESVESGFQVKDDKISLNYNFNDMVDFYRDELVKDVADALFKE
ncbi:V-type ATP synthase subunit E [Proteiniclasticum sp. C24MP]|uniref:V-type ATP synthase subunit E n=1 Tax=Proteiniclasticum sp. C24MP TaxID=3374101 RepID=UPI0037548CB3